MNEHTYDDRLVDRLVDDEGQERERACFDVVGVWMDGVPYTLAARLTYAEALADYDARMQARGNRLIPFYGIVDDDDPERGYGPWNNDEE